MKFLAKEKFILADSFLFGNLLQASDETYKFKLQVSNDYSRTIFDLDEAHDNREVLDNRYDDENCFRNKVEEEILLKPYDVLSSGKIMINIFTSSAKTMWSRQTTFLISVNK
jgi:hypothetical protein